MAKFLKGEIHNPKGINGGTTARNRLLNALLAEIEKDGNAEDIARVLVRRACQGSVKHLELVYDRVLGKAKQQIDANIQGMFKAYINFDPRNPASLPEKPGGEAAQGYVVDVGVPPAE